MIKSIDTGKPDLPKIPLKPKTKKLIREAAAMFHHLKLKADSSTCLPHFQLQVNFFSRDAEVEFFKGVGKCLIADLKLKRSKSKKK